MPVVTLTALDACEPLTSRVPPLDDVVPEYVLAPDRVSVPDSVFVSVAAPPITSDIVLLPVKLAVTELDTTTELPPMV